MKKYFNRLLTLVLFVSLLALSFVGRVNAYTTVTNDAGDYNYTTVTEDRRELINGVEYIRNVGYTTRSGKNYDQRVSIFTADVSKNSDVKIATWNTLNGKGTGFTRKGLLDIAKDYEKNNPGWIVLAGINADQYFPTFGSTITSGQYYYVPSAYYGQISNGDNWFVTSPLNNSNNIIGFKNDGSTKPFVNGKRNPKGFYLHVYDEEMNEVALFPVDGLNVAPGENGVSLLASYNLTSSTYSTVNKSGANDIYLIGNADMAYVANTVEWQSFNSAATDQFFGKGYITEVGKSVNFTGGNKFALEVTNEVVKAAIKVGTYVKVQREFDDAFEGIEEGIGYHTVQRKNGADGSVANAYNSRPYPRSCVGFDAEGKCYLMTNFGYNGSPLQGLYAQECNAIFKQYGVVDAWQMDGGGSVTCVCRDENGILNYAEACIEASKGTGEVYSDYRYILSGLFIVMKVAEAKVELVEKTAKEVSFTVDSSKLKGNYDAANIVVFDGDIELCRSKVDVNKDTNEIKVDGLTPGKEYSYELYVKKDGEDELRTFINGAFTTLKAPIVIDEVTVTKTSDGLDIKVVYKDEYKSLVKLNAYFGSKRVGFDTSNGTGTAHIKGEYSPLDLVLEAECSLDPTSSQRTNVEIKPKKAIYPVYSYFEYPINQVSAIIKELIK